MSGLRQRKERLAAALAEKRIREARRLQSNPDGGLLEFIRYFWHVLEPADPFIEGWPLEALCSHLEAITRGDVLDMEGQEKPFNRFLANVPPGFMKSLTVQVFWKAWEWGPMGLPHLRYVSFSYSPELTERDNAKFRDLISSPAYRKLWGHVFSVVGDGKIRVTNDKTGFSFASSFGGVGTGERGHRVILDDPHKLKGTQETVEARASVTTWVREAMQNRLNDLQRDAIVVIMQRLYEDDAAGEIMKHLGDEYCHLIIPMAYEPFRHFSHYTGWNGGQDPREYEGELAWPERFPEGALASFKRNRYLWAGQYQQTPIPRGGGLFKDEWWQPHQVVRDRQGRFQFNPGIRPIFVLASLDTAFSEKEKDDYSALSVWAVHDDPVSKRRCILLVDAWQKHLNELSGEEVDEIPGEARGAYLRRAQQKWGLCDWVAYTCNKQKVDLLIIENKNRCHDVIKTIKRLHANRSWGVQTIEPRGDKWSRAHSILDIFTDGMVHAPAEITEDGDVRFLEWAEMTIQECGRFPRGAHDDIVDTVSMAMRYLRDNNYAVRRDEQKADEDRAAREFRGTSSPIYPA